MEHRARDAELLGMFLSVAKVSLATSEQLGHLRHAIGLLADEGNRKDIEQIGKAIDKLDKEKGEELSGLLKKADQFLSGAEE